MELIVIQPKRIGNEEINSVDARDLHSRLGVKKDFSNWIKGNIKKLNLVENVDFCKVAQKGELSATGQVSIEYFLSLDVGKHISMMTNTATAHSVRTYFIEFEKKVKGIFAGGVRPEIEATDIFQKFNEVGRAIGLDPNLSAISANHAVTKITNVDVLALMGVSRLLAPIQATDYNPTELGVQFNPHRSPIQVNEMLVQLGYQTRTKVKQCPYETTSKGKPFCRLHDQPRQNTVGASQQLRWYSTILDQEDVQWATGRLAG